MAKPKSHSRLTRAFLTGGLGAAVVAAALVGLAMGRDRALPPEAVTRASAPSPTRTAIAGPTPSPTLTPAPTATPRQAAVASTATARPQSGGPHYALRGLDGRTISSDSQRGKVTVLFFIVPG